MKVSANCKTMLNILEDKVTYCIPDYQRPYSWTKEEVDELIKDLEGVNGTDHTHYFGAFVFNEENRKDNKIEVIDGQQRIATLMFILYVLRRFYKDPIYKNLEGIAYRETKLKEFLEFIDNNGKTIGSKLKLGVINEQFFNDYIVDGWNKEDLRKDTVKYYKKKGQYNNSKQIKDVFEYLIKVFDEKIQKENSIQDAVDLLKNFQDSILHNLEVVVIVVEQDTDAFLIFETLNQRGLELSSVDLIKNRLFRNCSGCLDFDDLKEKWVSMLRIVDSSVKKYIRHYWICHYEFVTHQSLFKSVRDKTEDKAKTVEYSRKIIEDLYTLAPEYNSLNNPYSGSFKDPRLKRALECMNRLGYDLTHPILLAGCIKFKYDETKFYELVKTCLNFLVRYVGIQRDKPGIVERKIAELAKKIKLDGDIGSVKTAFLGFSKDSEFRDAFTNLSVNYSSFFTYYLLSELEKYKHINTWVPPERTEVTVEHILPQSTDFNRNDPDQWGYYFTPSEHEVYLNRLGNLTLLGPKTQGKAGNKPFKDKQKLYKEDTDMILTNELADKEITIWDQKAIIKRQNEFADLALKIFSLD